MVFAPDISVDYGAVTPADLDRFGTNQAFTVTDRETRRALIVTSATAPVKKLGLTLRGAWKTFGGLRDYALEIDERALHVRTYSDGRVKITLDGLDVYTEQISIRTVKGIKERLVRARQVGDEVQDWALRELHAEALWDNARWELDRRRQQLNKQTE